jgi:hypothetical protein
MPHNLVPQIGPPAFTATIHHLTASDLSGDDRRRLRRPVSGVLRPNQPLIVVILFFNNPTSPTSIWAG